MTMDANTRIRADLQYQLISEIWKDEYLQSAAIEGYVYNLSDSELVHLRKFVNGEEEE